MLVPVQTERRADLIGMPMRSEYEVRSHLADLDDEHSHLSERFLRAQGEWVREIYSHAIADLAARRSILRWVLAGDSGD